MLFAIGNHWLQLIIVIMEDKIGSLKSYLYATKTEYPRIGHRAIQVGHNILVFGGTNANNQYVTTLLRINCENILVDPLPNISLRLQEFSLFSYRDQVYLWGGLQPMGFSNKLLKFTGTEFEIVTQNGHIPTPRSRHAYEFFSKRYLLVHGGMNNECFFKDFHILDCQTMTWNRVTVNIEIPDSISTHVFWSGGRGFFVACQTFNPKSRKIDYRHRIYEMRFTDFKQFKMNLELLNETEGALRPAQAKKEPTVILVNFESPYLMMIGGEIIQNQTDSPSCKDLWIFNLETLQWSASNIRLISAGFAFEAVFCQERLFLIGGITYSYRELASTIEVIDINADSLQAKLCKVCRQVYGIRQYSGFNKQFTIKFEQQESQRSFLTVQTVSKLARFIRHPFSALGLLIDNCINLNGTIISVQFKHFDPNETKERSNFQQMSDLLEKTSDNRLKMKYNYIKITDDTCGFTQNQIVECLCSFGIKTEKLTTDRKYEQQLQIRKQYGVNIKLGALRIAQTCLFVAKTQDDTVFVCYFSTIQENVGQRFRIISYFITEQGRSSDINYHIIKENVGKYLPQDYQQLYEKERTKVYLFNIQFEQMVKEVIDFDNYDLTCRTSPLRPFRSLKTYLESLYFTPYTGRVLRLETETVKFKSYPQIFKRDQKEKLVSKLDVVLKENPFKQFGFYRVLSPKYPIREVLVYHQNRLITGFDTRQANICGYVVVPDAVGIDLCKTKLQNHHEELILQRIISGIVRKYGSEAQERSSNY